MQEFTQLDCRTITEYEGEISHWCHTQSGAEIIALQNNDKENFFCFGFCTPPENHHGTAHILEHTVLCGSQKYPVRDPFLLLLRGSMQSFLNAMTYPDRTLFPAASPLEKDFFNLMAVYGDAVFFPLLYQEAFAQEGHRLLIKGRTLQHAGVVYNEMKGAYSSHENFAFDSVVRSLFPHSCYQFDSGGDPQDIPLITWEELKAFHARYYHPSNCCIFLYGDIPLEKKLAFLHTQFLQAFTTRKPCLSIPLETPLSSRLVQRVFFPAPAGDSALATVAVNWRLDPIWQKGVSFKLETLNHILLGANGAPFYFALQNSHLGEDLSPISGMDFDISSALFVAALRQVKKKNEEKVEPLVYQTLYNIVQQGIPADQVQAALNSVEFSRREMRSGSLGLRLARRLYRVWQYHKKPLSALFFEDELKQFKKDALQMGYFEQVIQESLLQNQNASTVIVQPDFTILPKQQKTDRKQLKAHYAGLTQAQKAALKNQAVRLRAYQKKKDEEGIVPLLTRYDVPEKVVCFDAQKSMLDGISCLALPDLGHGIYYWKVAFAIPHIPVEDLAYLPLLCRVLAGIGWQGVPYDEASREIVRKAASFSFSLDSGMDVHGQVQLHVIVTLKALPSQVETAQSVMIRTLCEPDFQVPERIKEIVIEFFNDSKAQLSYTGSSLAGLALTKYFSPSGAVDEQWFGLSQLMFLDKLLQSLQADPQAYSQLIVRLQRLHTTIFCKQTISVFLATDVAQLDHAQNVVLTALKALPFGPGCLTQAQPLPLETRVHKGYSAASQVNFVGFALAGSSYGTKEAAAEQLLAHYLSSGPLWEKIRMKGGAYGVQAHSLPLDQVFMMTSYRDPHIEQTWQVYRYVLEHALGITRHKLDQTLISLVGKEIRPVAIEEKLNILLRRSFLGIDDALRQETRVNLISCTCADMRHALQRLNTRSETTGVYVAIGPYEAIDKVHQKGLLQDVQKLP